MKCCSCNSKLILNLAVRRNCISTVVLFFGTVKERHKVILWTVREGKLLEDAVEWCRQRGVEFYAVNKDYPEETKEYNNHFSRKIKAEVWIDDRNVGGLPDWGTMYNMIKEHKSFEDMISEARKTRLADHAAPKQKHWWNF